MNVVALAVDVIKFEICNLFGVINAQTGEAETVAVVEVILLQIASFWTEGYFSN